MLLICSRRLTMKDLVEKMRNWEDEKMKSWEVLQGGTTSNSEQNNFLPRGVRALCTVALHTYQVSDPRIPYYSMAIISSQLIRRSLVNSSFTASLHPWKEAVPNRPSVKWLVLGYFGDGWCRSQRIYGAVRENIVARQGLEANENVILFYVLVRAGLVSLLY